MWAGSASAAAALPGGNSAASSQSPANIGGMAAIGSKSVGLTGLVSVRSNSGTTAIVSRAADFGNIQTP
ncbi:hypothetical protein GCM10009753_03060 [Streptantibioticus ferralitis]